MNVYSCWYHGNFGYSCRLYGRNWLFVPELGQPDGRIHRNLSLGDLLFRNTFEKKLEMARDQELASPWLVRWMRDLLRPGCKLTTIGGLLFITS
ncbi:MAG: hypothetical protein ACREUU_16325 [Gammaproteobacteria bacterium]